MADIPDDVKAQAWSATAQARPFITQAEMTGSTRPPPEIQGKLSPQIEDRLNSRTVDSYENFNRDPGQDRGGPDSGFEPGKG